MRHAEEAQRQAAAVEAGDLPDLEVGLLAERDVGGRRDRPAAGAGRGQAGDGESESELGGEPQKTAGSS
ncbi:MAG TPA: hypothetical protein VF121_09525 [Thermoanaerobaculia bacterium]|nr:hypothetical protein [Thermoanaerobaculia bacterium]